MYTTNSTWKAIAAILSFCYKTPKNDFRTKEEKDDGNVIVREKAIITPYGSFVYNKVLPSIGV